MLLWTDFNLAVVVLSLFSSHPMSDVCLGFPRHDHHYLVPLLGCIIACSSVCTEYRIIFPDFSPISPSIIPSCFCDVYLLVIHCIVNDNCFWFPSDVQEPHIPSSEVSHWLKKFRSCSFLSTIFHFPSLWKTPWLFISEMFVVSVSVSVI